MVKYNIIYADPPWRYGSGGARGGRYGKLDYNDMSTEELLSLPVSQIVDDTCALFMWVTGAFMADGIRLGEHWGFKYIRVDKVWQKIKPTGGRHGVTGPWGMTDCEFILLFTRGQVNQHQTERNQWVHYSEPYTGKHSEKPALFRDMVTARFPADWKRLEMFARTTPEGWDVWGDQAPGSVELPVSQGSVELPSIPVVPSVPVVPQIPGVPKL